MAKTVLVVDNSAAVRQVVGVALKEAEGQAVGVKSWVLKPFQPAQILAAVSRLILP